MAKLKTKEALKAQLDIKSSPLGTLLELTDRVVLFVDDDGVITYASPSSENLLGRSPDRLVGSVALDIVVAQDRPKAKRAFSFIREKTEIPISARLGVIRGDEGRIVLDVLYKNHRNDPLVKGVMVTGQEFQPVRATLPPADPDNPGLTLPQELMMLALEDLPLPALLEQALRGLTSEPWLSLEPFASVYLVVENTRTLSLLSHWGSDYHPRPCPEVGFDTCPFGRAAKTGEIQPYSEGIDTGEGCPELCPKTLLSIPIKLENKVLGVLNVCFPERYEHTQQQRSFLLSYADTMARIIKRSRHYDENSRLAAITRENPNPVIECDDQGRITYENPAARKLMWQHSVELMDLLPQGHHDIITNCLKGSCSTRRAESRAGERTYSWIYHPIASLGRMHIFGRDITERRRAEKQIVHDAMHDGLTGLPNRNLLLDRINGAIGLASRHEGLGYAVLMLDIDRFKVITESLGPAAGDRVLRKVARRLLESVGERDSVGRMGGDEFIVLVEDVGDPDAVVKLGEKISSAIDEPMEIGDHRVVISASMGIVIGSSDYGRPEEVLRDADTAMYRAKGEGRGQIQVFDPSMRSNVVARLQVQSDLRNAIENGELTVFYQPVLSLSDLRIRGFEALVRWIHPERGMIAPSEFITVAEETGLIIPLGELVMRKVARQLRIWRDSRLPLAWVAVNLSVEQFQMNNLVSTVFNIMDEAGVSPERMQLEITEGTAAANPERAVMMLKDLRERGIRVALDDFGTGYSSMSYLKRFPIDALKIDRSFVKDLPESHDDAAIATSVIAMAKSLGMKTVAEGVENERQAMFLKSRGCDEVQGFLYARPMEADRATDILKTGISS